MNTYFKALKTILEGKDAITFFSGAGLSVSSGLPDFRGDKDGFWKSNTPVHFSDFICPECLKGLVKVGTISFGQSLDTKILKIAHAVSAAAKYFISVGSSLKVSPANSFIKVAKENGAKIIILNKDATPFDDYADIVINDSLENIY